MEFFEELKQAAHNKFKGEPLPPWSDGYLFGVAATIEALREMMVGKPIEAIIEHEVHQDTESSNTEEWTTIESHPLYLDRYAECGFGDHHGTDGEEVYVMVFRSRARQEEEDDLLRSQEITQD